MKDCSGACSKVNHEKGAAMSSPGNVLQRAGRRGNGTAEPAAAGGANLPESVREKAVVRSGVYDAMRLRSQREVIRDVMLAAADCDTWLTLAELRTLTRYGEASISAQLRHLRKTCNGGYEVIKRRRGEPAGAHPVSDGEYLWEYSVARAGRPGVEGRCVAAGA